jgi:hypothetical protein
MYRVLQEFIMSVLVTGYWKDKKWGVTLLYCHDIGVCMAARQGLDWMIRFIALIHPTHNCSLLYHYCYFHTLQFTVTLVPSVFTSRILTTDSQQSHCTGSTL